MISALQHLEGSPSLPSWTAIASIPSSSRDFIVTGIFPQQSSSQDSVYNPIDPGLQEAHTASIEFFFLFLSLPKGHTGYPSSLHSKRLIWVEKYLNSLSFWYFPCWFLDGESFGVFWTEAAMEHRFSVLPTRFIALSASFLIPKWMRVKPLSSLHFFFSVYKIVHCPAGMGEDCLRFCSCDFVWEVLDVEGDSYLPILCFFGREKFLSIFQIQIEIIFVFFWK